MLQSRFPFAGFGIAAIVLAGLGLGYGAGRWWGSEPLPTHQTDSLDTAVAERSVAAGLAAAEPNPVLADKTAGKHALLVGVTRYDLLPQVHHLVGPANDVALLRTTLITRFHFADREIVTLTEEAGAGKRPTRANIEREFRRLAETARPNDQVVILLAGHGSQQPEKDPPPDPAHAEVDGLDETFLPADIGAWNGDKSTVTNAIIDDELGDWLKAITDKKAYVCIVFDCCHAGTMIRGVEKTREIPPEALVPKAALDKARARGQRTRGGDAVVDAVPFQLPGDGDRLVAIYACRSEQTEPEDKFTHESDAKYHGLLTYTICKELMQATTLLTYRELVQRIQARYAADGRNYPMPLVEGKERDTQLFGTAKWPGRSALLLRGDGDGWQVNAGSLRGLTPGSILAVYPPAGQADSDKLLGHVRITEARVLSARAEPCAYEQTAAPAQLPKTTRCEVVFTDYGDQRLRVAVDGDASVRRRWEEKVLSLAKNDGAVVELVRAPKQAQWLVREEEGKVYLVPAAGQVRTRDGKAPRRFGHAAHDATAEQWLAETLRKIARVRGLLAIAGESGPDRTAGDTGRAVDIRVKLVRYQDKKDNKGKEIDWPSGGLAVHAGDRVGFRMYNPNRFAVDATVLYIDQDQGISAFWPDIALGEDPRVPAGGRATTVPGNVTDTTLGLEHIVVIAVKAQKEPVDFGCLAQRSIERARGERGTAMRSPLGQLFERALFNEGGRRGLARHEMEDHTLRLLTWETLPKAAKGN